MRSSHDRRERAAVGSLLLLIAWWLLYAGLPILVRAGFDDGRRVACEGASAALMSVLCLRDRRADDAPRPAGRAVRPLLLLVPVFFLVYVSTETFCLAGIERPAELAGVSVWRVLRTCVTAPLMEELGCRWIAFRKLRQGFGFRASALASAVLFSLIHIDVNPRLAAAVIPSTLLYCLAYEMTGKLRYCAAGHAVFNILALPGTAWSGSALERRLWGAPAGSGTLALAAATVAVVLLCAFRDRIFVRRGGPDKLRLPCLPVRERR